MRIGQHHHARRGFTLLEALIASFIVAMAAVGVGSMLAASSQQSMAMNDTAVGQALARQLMEEIASRPIEDASGAISLGREPGEIERSQFDQIDDYNDFTDTTSSIRMLDGTTVDLGDKQTYTRYVTVEYRDTPSGPPYAGSDAPFCVVKVTVTSESGKSVQLVRLFARTYAG